LNRCEFKFLLSYAQYCYLNAIVKQTLIGDKYSIKNNKYPVFSIYFDTPLREFYHQKINGELNHLKVRLRCYSTELTPVSQVFLEAKIKKDKIQRKIRIKLPNIQYLKNPQEWKNSKLPEMEFFIPLAAQHQLRAACSIYFEREAYVSNLSDQSLRINFDTNLFALLEAETSIKNLKESRRLLPQGFVLMELKCNSPKLPLFWADILRTINVKLVQYSKYAEGMSRLDQLKQLNI
jgi:hypothetical protein